MVDTTLWTVGEDLIHRAISQEVSIFVMNLEDVRKQYSYFRTVFPQIKVFFSVKTHPSLQVLSKLHALGSGFEVVSISEAELCVRSGVNVDQIICSAPIKRRKDIVELSKLGVRVFTCDSYEELEKVEACAPGSQVILRILASSKSSVIDLSTKFGLYRQELLNMVPRLQKLSVVLKGLTFHVGGQCADAAAWGVMLSEIYNIFDVCKKELFTLDTINISGGFPAIFTEKVPMLEEIRSHMVFREGIQYWAEPGRVLVNTAGKMILPIIQSVERAGKRFLYVDVSRYGALWILGRGFEYPVSCTKQSHRSQTYTVASLSCDGGDILWDDIVLPQGLCEGEALIVHNVGAYTLPVFNVAYAGVDPMEYIVCN